MQKYFCDMCKTEIITSQGKYYFYLRIIESGLGPLKEVPIVKELELCPSCKQKALETVSKLWM